MKEKLLNFFKSNIFFAAAVNALIMSICIALTSFSFDSSSDFYNSIYICKEHFYYSSTINYILTAIIGSIQYAVGNFNCFVLTQIVMSFIAFSSISFVFANKYNKKKALVVTLLLNTLFAVNHYADIQSDKTAALLLTAGFLLILNAIHNKRYNLPCWLGCVEIAFGSFLNYRYFFIGMGFSVAFFIGDLISKRKYQLPFRKFFWYFRPYLLMFAFVTLLVMGLNQYSISVNHATPEAENYYEYSLLKEKVDSLPFPGYAEHKAEFAGAGIATENDYELLKHGYFDAEHSLNKEALQLVSDIQKSENTKTLLSSARNMFSDLLYHFSIFDCCAIIGIVFVILSIVFIVALKKRFSFFPLLYILCGVAASIAMRYCFSAEIYTLYGIWLMMYAFLLYSFNYDKLKNKNNHVLFRSANSYMLVSLACIIVLFACSSMVYQNNLEASRRQDKPQLLYTEIGRHPERYYVFDPVSKLEFDKYHENYIHPLWGFRSNYLDNTDSFGYFHNYDELRKRNMPDSIYEAVLTNNKIYVVDKNITFRKERYFSRNYGSDEQFVIYKQIKEIDNYKIYEVKIQ